MSVRVVVVIRQLMRYQFSKFKNLSKLLKLTMNSCVVWTKFQCPFFNGCSKEVITKLNWHSARAGVIFKIEISTGKFCKFFQAFFLKCSFDTSIFEFLTWVIQQDYFFRKNYINLKVSKLKWKSIIWYFRILLNLTEIHTIFRTELMWWSADAH